MAIFNQIHEDQVAVVEKFGKFLRIAPPGLVYVPVPGVWTVYRLSMRLQEIHVDVETRLADGVFCQIRVTVHIRVRSDEDSIYNAFYRLADPQHQVRSFVEHALRTAVSVLTLEDLYVQKNKLAKDVGESLKEQLAEYGYKIETTLVTNILPATHIVTAMNEVNVKERQKVAYRELAEADKTRKVKAAEGEAQAAWNAGQGLANQRRAIVEGTKDSVARFEETDGGLTAKEVMDLLMLTQYFDTIKDIAEQPKDKPKNKSTVVMLPKRMQRSTTPVRAAITNLERQSTRR